MKKGLFIAALKLFVIFFSQHTYCRPMVTFQAIGNDSILLADPTIFYHQDKYYLYGTSSEDGFLVYTSDDLKSWSGPVGKRDGFALKKGDSFGTSGFWAPQVFHHQGKFYMVYTANQNMAIAESDSPLGPFRQKKFKPFSGSGRQIDPFVFIDDDGKRYLYHVKVEDGNRIFVAELNDDLSDVKPETVKECISASLPWENTENASWPVTEGPTVLKRNALYYLFYSANDFRSIDYAVGCATSSSPYGPWTKYKGEPVISRFNTGQNGSGHGDFIQDKAGDFYYVFHTHNSARRTLPRKTAIVKVRFLNSLVGPAKVEVQKNSFYHLLNDK